MNVDELAKFSPCRTWRYVLWRWWNPNKPYAMFIGLNPSTADEIVNDNTVRRCIDFAERWGWGGLCMTNLFAFRATDPKVMKAAPDPVGPENDHWLLECAKGPAIGVIVAAWGTHGAFMKRHLAVEKMLRGKLECLGKTKGFFPKHPLYLAKTTELLSFK